jgi:hypothetical protein
MTTMVNPPVSKSKSNPLVYTPFLPALHEHLLVISIRWCCLGLSRDIIPSRLWDPQPRPSQFHIFSITPLLHSAILISHTLHAPILTCHHRISASAINTASAERLAVEVSVISISEPTSFLAKKLLSSLSLSRPSTHN